MVKDILFYKIFCWINLFLIYNFWYLSKISQDLVSRFCTKRNNLVENITNYGNETLDRAEYWSREKCLEKWCETFLNKTTVVIKI